MIPFANRVILYLPLHRLVPFQCVGQDGLQVFLLLRLEVENFPGLGIGRQGLGIILAELEHGTSPTGGYRVNGVTEGRGYLTKAGGSKKKTRCNGEALTTKRRAKHWLLLSA